MSLFRKYAFKAEHANMRTYYFGAETKVNYDLDIKFINVSIKHTLQERSSLNIYLLLRP